MKNFRKKCIFLYLCIHYHKNFLFFLFLLKKCNWSPPSSHIKNGTFAVDGISYYNGELQFKRKFNFTQT